MRDESVPSFRDVQKGFRMVIPLGLFGVDERNYRADLELLDRYVGFSSEIVRVSLLGLGAIGFYLKEFAKNSPDRPAIWFNPLLGTSAILLGVATACGLLHRYYATDGFWNHIRAHRLAAAKAATAEIHASANSSKGRYRLAWTWLLFSEAAVATGAGIAATAFGIQLGIPTMKPWGVATIASLQISAALAICALRWYRYHRPTREAAPPDDNGWSFVQTPLT